MKTETATTAQVLANTYRSLTLQLEAARQAESDLGERDEMLYRDQYALATQVDLLTTLAKRLGLVDEIVELLNK